MPSYPFVLTGEIDAASVVTIEPEMLAALGSLTDDPLVLDCSQLTFIDSGGLAMLVRVAEATDWRLRLENVPANCARLFHITALAEPFGIPAEPSEAMRRRG